jgi:hypothetical protein
MINLTKDASTLVALSLSEKVTLTATSVYFLFSFTSQDTGQVVNFTAPDISNNPIRYNLFSIIETSTGPQNLTAGTVTLDPQGYWTYECYQQLSQTNIYLSGVSGNAIEVGKVLVSGTTELISNGVPAFTASTPELRYVFQ